MQALRFCAFASPTRKNHLSRSSLQHSYLFLQAYFLLWIETLSYLLHSNAKWSFSHAQEKISAGEFDPAESVRPSGASNRLRFTVSLENMSRLQALIRLNFTQLITQYLLTWVVLILMTICRTIYWLPLIAAAGSSLIVSWQWRLGFAYIPCRCHCHLRCFQISINFTRFISDTAAPWTNLLSMLVQFVPIFSIHSALLPG